MPSADYPLRIRYAAGPVFQDLIEMTSAEFIANFGYRMARGFATNVSTGSLRTASGTAPAGTQIGTFTDTWRTEPVNSPNNTNAAGTTSSLVYYITQETSDPGSVPVPPLFWESIQIRETYHQTNTWNLVEAGNLLLQKIMDETIPGRYRLQQATPSGGTWTSRGTILDTTDSAGGGTTYTYTLWQKTEIASPPADGNRPLKWTGSALQEMTNAEQESDHVILRKHHLASGLMRYRFQTSAPGIGGTWIISGDTLQDKIQEYALVGSYFNVTANIVNSGSASVSLWMQNAL